MIPEYAQGIDWKDENWGKDNEYMEKGQDGSKKEDAEIEWGEVVKFAF